MCTCYFGQIWHKFKKKRIFHVKHIFIIACFRGYLVRLSFQFFKVCRIILLMLAMQVQTFSVMSCILLLTIIEQYFNYIQTPLWWGIFDTALCYKACQWFTTGQWFSPGTLISSTNKSDRHDISEILLKVELNTKTQTPIQLYSEQEHILKYR